MAILRRTLKILLAGFLLVALIGLLLVWQLPNYLEERVNNRLAALEKHRGEIDDLSIRWLSGEVLFHDLSIRRRGATNEDSLLQAPELVIEIHQLWPQPISASVVLKSPQIQLAVSENGESSQLGLGEDWVDLVEDIVPLPIKKGEIQNGEAHAELRLGGGAEPFAISLLNLKASAEHKKPSEKLTASLSGRLKRGGELTVNITSNAQDPASQSSASMKLQKTALAPYNALLRHYADLDVSEGQYSAAMDIDVQNRQVDGVMDVRLTELDVLQFGSDAPMSWLFEGLVGGLTMLVGKGPNNKIELEIPISGELDDVSFESPGQVREQIIKLLPSLDDWKKLLPDG